GLTAGGRGATPQTPLRSTVCANANDGSAQTKNAETKNDLFIFVLFLRFVVAQPQFDAVAVGERHLPHESEIRRVLRVVALDRHGLALAEVRARDAGAARGRGTQARQRPRRHLPARVL